MKECFFCKGKIVKTKVNHFHCWGDKTIYFENIEAEVCKQCGEVYFSPEVLKMMDEKTQTLTEFEKTINIPVVSLSEVKET